ncbi:MAG: glutamine--fructose-6-phosphate aminotransferase, partial [Gammaproteobacteria bacterium]|nr:glutamine--fructose-6-phosphate aminotransferase [Gammaproteobacteria bacterium]
MCGIVGVAAKREVGNILLEGLRRLEYRGYDSAGLAILDSYGSLDRLRTLGKVDSLNEAYKENTLEGSIGIAHTRWATHGKPSEKNAHPHRS